MSARIWLNDKLASSNYTILTGNLQAYSSDATLYVFGFQSPGQVERMQLID